MIGVQRKQPQDIAITKANRAHPARHVQAVDSPSFGPAPREDCLPMQAFIPIELIPFHLVEFLLRRKDGQSLVALQSNHSAWNTGLFRSSRLLSLTLAAQLTPQHGQIGLSCGVALRPRDRAVQFRARLGCVKPQFVLRNMIRRH